MTETPTLLDNVSQTFRDHGLTAAITALMGGSLAVAATVTRKAFTNEAMLERLEHELAAERERYDNQRAEDRRADAARLERIETDVRAMRDLIPTPRSQLCDFCPQHRNLLILGGKRLRDVCSLKALRNVLGAVRIASGDSE